MTSVNANTGLFFNEDERREGLDLVQSVEDRILTIRGARTLNPTYGSYALELRDINETITSIREALASDGRITRLDFQTDGNSLVVLVNGGIEAAI